MSDDEWKTPPGVIAVIVIGLLITVPSVIVAIVMLVRRNKEIAKLDG